MKKTSDILKLFSADPQLTVINEKNDFERMAIFTDGIMKETAKEMQDDLVKFIETGDYSDYLRIENHFKNITKYMNSRDGFITHNPNRNSRGY